MSIGDDFHNSKLILTTDAFVRSVQVNSTSPHALFLGAGASISSGVQSANSCIWDWKRRIFLTKNPSLINQVGDTSVPSVQQRIQRWLEVQGGCPTLGSNDEYGYYIERCFPIHGDRRSYFQELVSRANPHVGYQTLCLLAEAGIIDSIWTTNFDGLTMKAVGQFQLTPVEVGLDTTHRIVRPYNKGELLHVSVHGDYRYDQLKNTPSELQNQDEALRKALIERTKDTHLIVSGYSGRDLSIMNAFSEAYGSSGSGRLYWCGHDDQEPSDAVKSLISLARSKGREAYYVHTNGFDLTMIRLGLACLTDVRLNKARLISEAAFKAADSSPSPFEIEPGTLTAVVKTNAFPIRVPTEFIQFETKGFDNQTRWDALHSLIKGKEIAAVFKGTKILALGNIEEIKSLFSNHIANDLERTPIQDSDLSYDDGVIQNILKQALVKSMAKTIDLGTDEDSVLWAPNENQKVSCFGRSHYAHPAVLVFLRRYGQDLHLVIKPTLKVFDENGNDAEDENNKEAKRQLLTRQWNKSFAETLDRWQTTFCPENAATFSFPIKSSPAVTFTLAKTPCYGGILTPGTVPNYKKISFPPQHLKFHGSSIDEPALIFSNQSGTSQVKDTHQLRGIVQNRPFDFSLTQSGLSPEVRVGVICTQPESKQLEAYLAKLHSKARADSKDQYLIDYPGFASALGTPLDLPTVGGLRWQYCKDPDPKLDERVGSAELVANIKQCIDALTSAHSPQVIIILIPSRWKKFESYVHERETFDLHNHIKAYCVRKGVATQLLRESTFSKPYQCEVLWWIAMSLYVKSFRTPWILEGLDNSTAYVGLGFGYDKAQGRDSKIVLGCSHIYDSSGQGLKYKLSKVDSPIWRNKNPHLSKEDARRLGDTIRQLFFESSMSLPRRVVIHKNTPFLKDEREGLIEGLGKVDAIDMLEITIDSSFRGIASRQYQGKLQPDGFPIKRGTILKVENRKAFLWVHGSASGIENNKTYYLGKSRIPAPVTIKRHFGHTSLSTLAVEILGLSKMNWNSFDLYNRLPATLESSAEIARIGSLLERFGPSSYDYRLFI